MTAQYILPLDDPQAVLETVGGKGASLARMAAAGLPVPGGFHVTTAAYKRFVLENDLQPRVLAALDAVDVDQPATLDTASAAIYELFLQAPIPPEIASAIAGRHKGSVQLKTSDPGRTQFTLRLPKHSAEGSELGT